MKLLKSSFTCLILASIAIGCAPKKYELVYEAMPVDLVLDSLNEKTGVAGSSAFQHDSLFVWGGSTIKSAEDGRYYMIYSGPETGLHPFNNAWIFGSKMGLAVSDRPDGGFKHLGFFMNRDGFARDSSSWDAQTVCNPTIRRFNDKYYLYYIGSKDRATNEGVLSATDTLSRRLRVQQFLQIGVIEFDTFDDLLSDNFKPCEKPVLSPRTRVSATDIVNPSPIGTIIMPDNIIVCNPSVVYRPSDGKYLMYFKGNRYQPHWRGVLGVAIADSPTGPFRALDRTVMEIMVEEGITSIEDPYVWYNKAEKKFFAIFKDFKGHYMRTGHLGDGAGLAIMESKDGYDWTLPKHSLFMKKQVILESGDTLKVARLERPQLLIDEDGIPEVIYFACAVEDVNPRVNGGSFNLQIRLKHKKVEVEAEE